MVLEFPGDDHPTKEDNDGDSENAYGDSAGPVPGCTVAGEAGARRIDRGDTVQSFWVWSRRTNPLRPAKPRACRMRAER